MLPSDLAVGCASARTECASQDPGLPCDLLQCLTRAEEPFAEQMNDLFTWKKYFLIKSHEYSTPNILWLPGRAIVQIQSLCFSCTGKNSYVCWCARASVCTSACDSILHMSLEKCLCLKIDPGCVGKQERERVVGVLWEDGGRGEPWKQRQGLYSLCAQHRSHQPA